MAKKNKTVNFFIILNFLYRGFSILMPKIENKWYFFGWYEHTAKKASKYFPVFYCLKLFKASN
ncbi:MAG: hypothetical protein D6707_06625 [Bacteroidetes bacterium]|nr:MAG: hypothetical protein D6707_06625 [Bacteroidota bacterium]